MVTPNDSVEGVVPEASKTQANVKLNLEPPKESDSAQRIAAKGNEPKTSGVQQDDRV